VQRIICLPQIKKKSSAFSFFLSMRGVLFEAVITACLSNSTPSVLLAWSGIGVEGAKALAATLEKNSSVTSIDLSSNKAGDEGAKALAAAMEKNTSLTSIVLRYNPIDDAGLEALVGALQKNTRVTKLCVYQEREDEEGYLLLSQYYCV
jgi:hypothetical protein